MSLHTMPAIAMPTATKAAPSTYEGTSRATLVTFGISAVVHLALYGLMPNHVPPPKPATRPATLVEVELPQPPPPKSKPAPELPKPKALAKTPAAPTPKASPRQPPRRRRARRSSPRPQPSATPPKVAAQPATGTPLDLDGVVLSGQGGLAVAVGPAGGEAKSAPAPRPAVAKGRGTHGGRRGPPLLPAASLRQRPQQPSASIDRLLRKLYPAGAKAAGIEGLAKVRVRVDASGAISVLRVLQQSNKGFGNACRRALEQGGAWTPGKDKHGSRASTVITFSCHFRIRS